MQPPRIVVTLTNPERSRDPASAELKNARYLEQIVAAGGSPLPLDDRASDADRRQALATMDGLLITGGADLDPARYGELINGARALDPGRDALDAAAYRAAVERGRPVLGVCRGLQSINVFEGGSLVQHVDDHESEPYPSASVRRHPIRLQPGSRLATLIGPGTGSLDVNSYHHQAVTSARLAPTLRVSAAADHAGGEELVEGLESADDDRWLVGIQCHPERSESTPPALANLWTSFVEASSLD